MRWLIACLVLLAVLLPASAHAHVGSPDVFYEADAGPYKLFVTVRVPQVIPGVAEIEVRSESPDVDEVTVVPMKLTGPGSELAPVADVAERSGPDPQLFTASLWLMEHGAMQVRVTASGARGRGTLSVPVTAVARSTLGMSTGLAGLLLALLALLATSIIAIAAGAAREATSPPGQPAGRRSRVALIVVSVAVAGVVVLGGLWWRSVAGDYEALVARPWLIQPRVEGCRIAVKAGRLPVMLDHGHPMHMFLIRMPALDQLAHLHPVHVPDDETLLAATLPPLAAGHYKLFAEVVLDNGYPLSGTADLDLPDLACPAPAGDDSTWSAGAAFGGGARMEWARPPVLRAGVAQLLSFRVVEADGSPATLEPYMGMTAHGEILRRDGSVFAHVHPSGTVPMPALMLAGPMAMPMPDMAMPSGPVSSTFTLPFGFPRGGDYTIFVQVKRRGVVETGAFEVHVADRP